MELANRDQIEKKFAKELGRVNQRTRKEILKLVGDPPKLENLTLEVWDKISTDYAQVITPALEEIFIASAEQMIADIGYGVDLSLINQNAITFSRNYGFDLVRNITDNRQKVIRAGIDDYYSGKLNLQGLTNRISREFSPVRAKMIAVSETTRASTEGTISVVNAIESDGIQMRGKWNTVNDGSVCKICDPYNQVVSDVVGSIPIFRGQQVTPPLHVGCRCDISFELVTPETT